MHARACQMSQRRLIVPGNCPELRELQTNEYVVAVLLLNEHVDTAGLTE